MTLTKLALAILAIGGWLAPSSLYGQRQAIDVNRSTLTIRVFKSGIFSAFAHDHEIEAPIESGSIDSSSTSAVQLRIESRKMHVLDPDISAKDRSKIQDTMQGSSVLDSEHFREISYHSIVVSKTAEAHWEVRGNLSLHGTNHPVTVMVSFDRGHYRGSGSFKQSIFGINPIRIAGGTVKVKDEIKIEFDIVPVQ